MTFDVMTLFPELIDNITSESIILLYSVGCLFAYVLRTAEKRSKAFFLCGLPALLPARISVQHAPAEMLGKLCPKSSHVLFLTTPELADTLWYSVPGKRFAVAPLDKMIVPPGKHTVILVREKEAAKLPPARKKIVLRASGLAILEYNTEIEK